MSYHPGETSEARRETSMDRDFEARFTMSELVEATGLTPRTIRYYIQEGLAPPAAGRGRSSYYTAAHVEALTRIRELRERNLSHDEIRQALAPAPPAHAEAGETWTRIGLHPALEIHVRADAPEHVRALVRELQDAAGRWLGPEEDG